MTARVSRTGWLQETGGNVSRVGRLSWQQLNVELVTYAQVGLVGFNSSNTYTANFTAKYATKILRDVNGNLLANLNNLRGVFFDSAFLGINTTAPVAASTVLTTNGAGKFSWDVTAFTALTNGQTGYLVISNSNGNPAQTPVWSGYQGPVTLTSVP